MSATVCSAALVMLEVGALTTMTPALVAASTSTLSRPTPARATTRSLGAWAMASASTCGGAAHDERVHVGECGQELGTVGAVGVTDFEVGAQNRQTGLGEFFCDQYDGLVHRLDPSETRRLHGPRLVYRRL